MNNNMQILEQFKENAATLLSEMNCSGFSIDTTSNFLNRFSNLWKEYQAMPDPLKIHIQILWETLFELAKNDIRILLHTKSMLDTEEKRLGCIKSAIARLLELDKREDKVTLNKNVFEIQCNTQMAIYDVQHKRDKIIDILSRIDNDLLEFVHLQLERQHISDELEFLNNSIYRSENPAYAAQSLVIKRDRLTRTFDLVNNSMTVVIQRVLNKKGK